MPKQLPLDVVQGFISAILRNPIRTQLMISTALGGVVNECCLVREMNLSIMNWMIDNILSQIKKIGIANDLDVTLLANVRKIVIGQPSMSNRNLRPKPTTRLRWFEMVILKFFVNAGVQEMHWMARLNYSLRTSIF